MPEALSIHIGQSKRSSRLHIIGTHHIDLPFRVTYHPVLFIGLIFRNPGHISDIVSPSLGCRKRVLNPAAGSRFLAESLVPRDPLLVHRYCNLLERAIATTRTEQARAICHHRETRHTLQHVGLGVFDEHPVYADDMQAYLEENVLHGEVGGGAANSDRLQGLRVLLGYIGRSYPVVFVFV